MTDDSTAEKATDRLELALDPDKRGGWRRLTQSELVDLRAVIADAREVESLREQLAEAQATIEKVRSWAATYQDGEGNFYRGIDSSQSTVLDILSAPSSTEDNEPEHPECCGKDVPGTVPSWAGEDQIDPCICALPWGHDGKHKCSHEAGGNDHE